MDGESSLSVTDSPDPLNANPPRIIGVIPARLSSNRLPGKVLLPIAGQPMIGWVYQAAAACPQLDQVIVATDSEEVMAYVESRTWPAMMTASSLASGTDRVRAVAERVDADIYVNIQGDEPLLRRDHIEDLLRPFFRASAKERAQVQVTTLSCACLPEEVRDPNAVKVVTAIDGRALYFSRLPIPYCREGAAPEGLYRKHLGLYAYRKAALEQFAALPPGRIERVERLEQLRLLENGIPIHVEPTRFSTIGVDTEEDRRAVEKLLLARKISRESVRVSATSRR